MESKKGNITLFYQQNPKAFGMTVLLSLKYKCDDMAIRNLLIGQSGVPDARASLAYALFLKVKNKMSATATLTEAFKVSNFNCFVTDDAFNIKWNTIDNGSGLQKTLVGAVSQLFPASVFPIYSANQRLAYHGSDAKNVINKAEFGYCVNEMQKAIAAGITCVATGRAKIKKDKIDVMVVKMNAVFTKFNKKQSTIKDVSAPANPTASEAKQLPSIVSKGVDAVVRSDMIRSKFGDAQLAHGSVMSASLTESKLDKMTSSKPAKQFGDKYSKAKGKLPVVIAQQAMVNSNVSAANVKQIIKSNVTPAQLTASIKSSKLSSVAI